MQFTFQENPSRIEQESAVQKYDYKTLKNAARSHMKNTISMKSDFTLHFSHFLSLWESPPEKVFSTIFSL